MVFLKVLFIIVEVLCCLMLIGLILLQKSKSEGLGMAFGAGVGESLFGARAGNVLSKATVILGIVFMANTLLLGIIFAQKDKTLMDQVPVAPAQPAAMQGQPMDTADLLDVAPTTTEQPAAEQVQPTAAVETGEGGAASKKSEAKAEQANDAARSAEESP